MDGILKNRDRAMTLMEILIVIALIAVLAGVGISNMGGVLDSGKKKAAKAFLESTVKAACSALYAYKDYNDVLVNKALDGIKVTAATDASPATANLNGLANFFDSTIPLDPWGAPWDFSYVSDTKTLTVVSTNGGTGTYEFKDGKIEVKVKP
ncbi:MAG: type II secretion system GspH family protein [Puniceicoccales bacterium]|jgi:prepilin-type N-terminal cleavage/methylation domain-containing protein|nr:type II secretion system GspH family protein [Puniceicoccales bacterium]